MSCVFPAPTTTDNNILINNNMRDYVIKNVVHLIITQYFPADLYYMLVRGWLYAWDTLAQTVAIIIIIIIIM